MKIKRLLVTNLLLFGFILGVHEGKVALWKDNRKDPIKVFPYQVSVLPEADQKRLEAGIHADSISELYKMVQDYLS